MPRDDEGSRDPVPALCLPLRGTVLADRYRLDEPLGCGGVADVYRGVDQALGRAVAVKVFRPEAGPELAEQRRFEQEGRTLAALQHPNLVTLYDAGVADDRAYLVLQLVDGNTLGERLRAGPLDPVEAARIGAAIADALGCVHLHKVVHRDVKPSNVLLDGAGGVYLTDFGIARMVDAPAITATGLLVGTAAYLSPEQVSGQGVEPASDLYALGLVLLECLTGQRVYQGGVAEMALARLTKPPQIPPEVGPRWHALLTALTAREPAERPAADAVAAQLRWLAEHPGDDTATMPAALAGTGPAGTAVIGAQSATAAAEAGTGDPGPDTEVAPAPGPATEPGAVPAAGPAAGPGKGAAARRPGRSRLVAAVGSVALIVAVVLGVLALRPGPEKQSPTPERPAGPQQPRTSAPVGQDAGETGAGDASTGKAGNATSRTPSVPSSKTPSGPSSSAPAGGEPTRSPSSSPPASSEPTPTTPGEDESEPSGDPSTDPGTGTDPGSGGGEGTERRDDDSVADGEQAEANGEAENTDALAAA